MASRRATYVLTSVHYNRDEATFSLLEDCFAKVAKVSLTARTKYESVR